MKTVEQALRQYHAVDVPTKALIAAEARRYVPGHEEIFVAALGLLQTAMEIGDTIFCGQYDPSSFEIVTILEEMQRLGAPQFSRFLDATKRAGGRYDHYSREKLEPDFTREDLRSGYALLVSSGSHLVDAEVSGGALHLPTLEARLFDPTVDATLPESRGFYLTAINCSEQSMLLARIRVDPALKSHYTVVDMDNGNLVAIPFTEMYGIELGLMHGFVDDAIQKFQELEVRLDHTPAHGLRSFTEFLRAQNRANSTLDSELVYSPTDRARVRAYKVEEPAPFFFGLSFESTYDDPFTMKMAMAGTLSIETEECRALAPFVAKFLDTAALEQSIPYTPAIRAEVPFVPVLMHDCVYRSGHDLIGGQALAATYRSEDNKVNDEEGVVIVAWRNVIAAKAEAILSPIARTILPAEKVAAYGDNFDRYLAMAFSVGILSHEQRHFIGKQMDQLALKDALGEIFSDVDEGLAEIGRVYSFRELSAGGFETLDARALEEFLYDTYFADVFRHMRFGPTSPYRRSAEWRLNYLVQNGGVEVGEDVRIRDYSKFKDAVADLYAFHLEIMQTGNRVKANEYIEKYALRDGSSLMAQKTTLIDRVNEKGIPRDIVLQYQV